MKTEHFNGLTEAEAERIAILMEECGEVIQICGKILRHGYESFNPYNAEKITNRELLTKELGDVLFAYKQMADSSDIIENQVLGMADIKEFKIQQFLHHQSRRIEDTVVEKAI